MRRKWENSFGGGSVFFPYWPWKRVQMLIDCRGVDVLIVEFLSATWKLNPRDRDKYRDDKKGEILYMTVGRTRSPAYECRKDYRKSSPPRIRLVSLTRNMHAGSIHPGSIQGGFLHRWQINCNDDVAPVWIRAWYTNSPRSSTMPWWLQKQFTRWGFPPREDG